MIFCRSFFRLDRAWKISNINVKSEFRYYFQGSCCFHGSSYHWKMSGAEDTPVVMKHNKKQKMVNVWRPVPAQSDSIKEKVEAQSQVLEPEVSSGMSVSGIQLASTEADSVGNPANETTASHTLKDDEALEKGLFPSADKHSVSVQVGSSLIRFVKGKGGSMQKQIEDEMGVRIAFPSTKHDESIIIEGNTIESITRASEKVQVIIDEAVKSPNLDYSHFVSLPLALHPELVNKLNKFQNSILGVSDAVEDNLDSNSDEGNTDDEEHGSKLDSGSHVAVQLKVGANSEDVKVDITNIPLTSYPPKALNSSSRTHSDLGIDRSIFIKPKTFHLTVLMLKLWNKERVDAASAVLQSVSSKVMDVLGGKPVFVKLKGLDCMRGSLAKARVLYAPVEEVDNKNRLLRACQVIIDAYVEAGLVLRKDAQQKLKLHATIMNARHRKRQKKTRKFDSFDARGIFKQYGSEEWGEYLIREAHLSQRFVFDENGYYHCCASIPFPDNTLAD